MMNTEQLQKEIKTVQTRTNSVIKALKEQAQQLSTLYNDDTKVKLPIKKPQEYK